MLAGVILCKHELLGAPGTMEAPGSVAAPGIKKPAEDMYKDSIPAEQA